MRGLGSAAQFTIETFDAISRSHRLSERTVSFEEAEQVLVREWYERPSKVWHGLFGIADSRGTQVLTFNDGKVIWVVSLAE